VCYPSVMYVGLMITRSCKIWTLVLKTLSLKKPYHKSMKELMNRKILKWRKMDSWKLQREKVQTTPPRKVGLDLAVGTEQPTHTYSKRMKDFFNSSNKHGNQRSEVSIRHRWTTISTECQKWLACLASVELINPSGTNGGVCWTIHLVCLSWTMMCFELCYAMLCWFEVNYICVWCHFVKNLFEIQFICLLAYLWWCSKI
jgi:hypothetical protein